MVLSVRPPGAEDEAFEDYSYFELKLAFESVSAEECRQFTHSLDGARLLLGPLILQRHHYGELPPWLDEGENAPARPPT